MAKTSNKHVSMWMFIRWHLSWATPTTECLSRLDPIQHGLGQYAFRLTMTSNKRLVICIFIWWHMFWATPITYCASGLHLVQHYRGQDAFPMTMDNYKHVAVCMCLFDDICPEPPNHPMCVKQGS